MPTREPPMSSTAEFRGPVNGQNAIAGAQAGTIGVHFDHSGDTTKDTQTYDEARACRDALFLTNPYIDREEFISTKGKRITGTCEWIRENRLYQS